MSDKPRDLRVTCHCMKKQRFRRAHYRAADRLHADLHEQMREMGHCPDSLAHLAAMLYAMCLIGVAVEKKPKMSMQELREDGYALVDAAIDELVDSPRAKQRLFRDEEKIVPKKGAII